jgi:hypothetical protein
MLPETINKTGHRHAAKNTSHLGAMPFSYAAVISMVAGPA